MKAITSEQMRRLDQRTSEAYDIPSEELMRRAGRGVGLVVDYLIDRAHMGNPAIQLIAGRGNNGGDAFVAATWLHDEDYNVEVLVAGSVDEIRGDALRHLGKMRGAGVPVRELPTKEDWEDELSEADGGQVLVDGVLGIGVKGPPRGPVAGAIHYLNALADGSLVVAINVPSGLDADTGEAPGEAVQADVTATIGLPKVGLLEPRALPYVGNVEVVHIGIPPDLVREEPGERELITDWDVRQYLPRRAREAHKGVFGHVLVIGGTAGYAGAPALAARAALRAGAGLVSAVVPRSLVPVVGGAMLEVMTHGAPETATGSLAADAWAPWRERAADFRALVVGPGMTRHPDTAALVQRLLQECLVPLVLDADALNVLAGHTDWLAAAACPVVLTPHPGELARLLDCDTAAIQADRFGAARRAAERTRATVVLKGAGTIVTAVGKPLAVNLTGNPGMATGGVGDVLGGVIAALLAQGLAPFEAACAGVYLHGRAGDSAARHLSQAGLIAGDVVEELPQAFRDIGLR